MSLKLVERWESVAPIKKGKVGRPRKKVTQEKKSTMKAKDLPDLLTIKEAAAILRCGKTHVYDLINSGELEYQPVGKNGKLVGVNHLSDYLSRMKRKKHG